MQKSLLHKQLTLYLKSRIPNATLELTPLPQCPEISLYLINQDYPQHELSHEQAQALMDNPPYWGFCWASGQVLAQMLLTQAERVQGKTVIDFGSGSAVVAIAAKKAGASRVIACDNDPLAIQAGKLNALRNQVEIEFVQDYEGCPDVDVICVADVFYDQENLPLLNLLQSRSKQVIVADSRLKGESLPNLKIASQHLSHTVPDLNESSDFNCVSIYQ